MDDKEISRFMEGATDYTGVPTRVYKNEKLIACFPDIEFLRDYVELYLEQIFAIEHPVSILYTKEDLYFCVMKIFDYVLVSGPATEVLIHPVQVRAIVRCMECGEDEEILKKIADIPKFPVSSIIFMACIGYHQFTGNKLNPSEVLKNYAIHESRTAIAELWKTFCEMDQAMLTNELIYQFERKCIQIIRMGNEEDIEQLVNEFSMELPQRGTYPLRHYKNTFIVATTVVSRAVVDLGVSAAESFALADYYINSCESVEQSDILANLFLEMMKGYQRIVRNAQEGIRNSELLTKVDQYIQTHMTEKLLVGQMAYELGMSRNSLSGHFKKETGHMLSEYIVMQKVERAKYIISTTDYSFAEVSAYLAFSSQSHFQRVFKKYAGMTPREYRNSGNERNALIEKE